MAISKKTGTIPYGPSAPILESGTAPFSVTWYPDETYVPALVEAAASQGVSPEHLMQDVMGYGISQGWSYAAPPGVETLFLSRDEANAIRELTGHPVVITGPIILNALRRNAARVEPIDRRTKAIPGEVLA